MFLISCASSTKSTSKSFDNEMIGQNELDVLKALGVPTNVEHTNDGGKIMIYESRSKGMFLTPYNKPAINYNTTRDMNGQMQGLTFTSNTNTAVNNPKYTIHSSNVSFLKVYIDENGNVVSVEQNMSPEQLEIYHKRFKHFNDQK